MTVYCPPASSLGQAKLLRFGLGPLDQSIRQHAHAFGLFSLDCLGAADVISARDLLERVLLEVRDAEVGLHVEVEVSELFHVLEVGDGLHGDRAASLLQQVGVLDDQRVVRVDRH